MNFKTGRPTGEKTIYDYLEMDTDDSENGGTSDDTPGVVG